MDFLPMSLYPYLKGYVEFIIELTLHIFTRLRKETTISILLE